MPEAAVSFEGNQICVGSRKWAVPYAIENCTLIGDRVVVLYELMSGRIWWQFKNLEAFDLEGHKLWTAEHPTNESADAYVQLLSLEPFTAFNFVGFVCQIDLATGKILKKEFTK